MLLSKRVSAHQFNDLLDIPFEPSSYSRFKFGDDSAAKVMGTQLAEALILQRPGDLIAARDIVLVPSPYNNVANAATVMTQHLADRLNLWLVDHAGKHASTSIIDRKVSYINDYGFLPKEKRQQLIAGDEFYVNTRFLEGKLVLFVDDILITGSHEERLIQVMAENNMTNDHMFLYYAQYLGTKASIESELNFAAMPKSNGNSDVSRAQWLANIMNNMSNHVIVRPLKFILSMDLDALAVFNEAITHERLTQVLNGCLAEGYYRIPAYAENLAAIRAYLHKTQPRG